MYISNDDDDFISITNMIDNHFLNDFLEKCPSGRYRTIKYRSTWLPASETRSSYF